MLTKENKLKVKDIIRSYKVGHWMFTCDSGAKFRQLTSEKSKTNMLIAMLLFGVIVVLNLLNSSPEPWEYWIFGGMGVLFLLVLLFTQNRELFIDLEKKEVASSVFGISLSRYRLSEFNRFQAEGGVIINGLDTGGHLYMKFKRGRIRIATFRNEQDFQNLQYAILELLNLGARIKSYHSE